MSILQQYPKTNQTTIALKVMLMGISLQAVQRREPSFNLQSERIQKKVMDVAYERHPSMWT